MIGLEFSKADQEKLKREFSALSDTLQKRVIIRVLKNNTRELERRMKANAPVDTNPLYPFAESKNDKRNHKPGHLRASIGTVIGRGKDFPTLWVRPRFINKRFDPWYIHFVTSGSEQYTKAENRAGRPFVDDTWNECKVGVEQGITTDLQRQIQTEIDKLK